LSVDYYYPKDTFEMRSRILRKLLVILIVIIPVFSGTDCKKQARCGCEGDVLYTFTLTPCTVYWSTGATISFTTLNDPYSTYTFCNPTEMFQKLTDAKSGDVLQVSGHIYWDCNYLYQSSNYSYSSLYKQYVVQGSNISSNLYGKK
jgi:hypothetical protein